MLRSAALMIVGTFLLADSIGAQAAEKPVHFCGARNWIAPGLGVSLWATQRPALDHAILASISIRDANPISHESHFFVEYGDLIPWNQRIYRVSDVYFDQSGRDRLDKMRRRPDNLPPGVPWAAPVGGEVYDCITLTPDPGKTPLGDADLVLSNQLGLFGARNGWIQFGSQTKTTFLILEDVKTRHSHADVASIAWQSGDALSWNGVGLGNMNPALPVQRLNVRVGDAFTLQNIGSFKAKQIVANRPHQPEWLVMSYEGPAAAP